MHPKRKKDKKGLMMQMNKNFLGIEILTLIVPPPRFHPLRHLDLQTKELPLEIILGTIAAFLVRLIMIIKRAKPPNHLSIDLTQIQIKSKDQTSRKQVPQESLLSFTTVRLFTQRKHRFGWE